jgi:hypothetical protein
MNDVAPLLLVTLLAVRPANSNGRDRGQRPASRRPS